MAQRKFSPKITGIAIVLALIMLRCSWWQWQRYEKKVLLVQTYEANSTSVPTELTPEIISTGDFSDLWNTKVQLSGSYDYDRQIIVTNKKAGSGPGHHLLTPLKIAGTDKAILVSRGFIPMSDRSPESWTKYRFADEETFQGVLKRSIEPMTLGPKNPKVGNDEPYATIWFFEEIGKMAQQLPYEIVDTAFVQRIGGPPEGTFPEQAISIEVPPSTHFGYTIEWALLAFATLSIAFIVQAFPRKNSRFRTTQEASKKACDASNAQS